MNEGYMCNTCKIGKVRPIQFSLKQAIINCDNPDCDSYLEKWPWECIITRPILDSSDLCKYEKDSVCSSSDSSGVHSDLGSSGVSQYSVTDREVETLLQRSFTSDFDFECINRIQNTLQWQSGTIIQEQEPFVALDDKMFSTDMPLDNNENIFENKYSDLVSSFQNDDSESISARNKQELLSLISDTGLGGSSAVNASQDTNTHYRPNVDSDLESWLCKLEPSDLLENSNGDNCDTKLLENGDSSYISPSKTLIPSLNSAFSEVSPSKLNLFSYQDFKTCETPRENDNLKSKESLLPYAFSSPVSSGFNEDCGDHTAIKSLAISVDSLPNDLSALDIQINCKPSTPEQLEDTAIPSNEIYTPTIETQIEPKPLAEDKKENAVALRKRGRPVKVHRNETRCRSEFVTDPWSIPEMYIDELNIEVVLKNEAPSPPPPPPSSAEHENIQSGQQSHSSNFVSGSEENASQDNAVELKFNQNDKLNENCIIVTYPSLSALSDSSQSQCQEVIESIHLPPQAYLGKEINQPETTSIPQGDLYKPNKQESEKNYLTPQIVDLYKPVTLQPEVIDHHHEYFNATPNFSNVSKLRLSVGYKTEDDVQSKYHSLSETDEVEDAKDLNTSSRYFSSLLSNIDFDENFIIIGKEKESSLENLVGSKFLCPGSDSEDFGLESNNNDVDNSENNFSSSPSREMYCKIEEEDNLGNISFKTEEYESESELPIVTFDDNDDLELFIPVKKEIKEEKEIEFWNHNLISMQDYSRRKKIRHKNLGHFLVGDSSVQYQLPPNSYGNSLNVIDTQDHLYSRPSAYNVNIDSFTMGQLHDNFGNLKKEPELFETCISDFDDSLNRQSRLEQRNSPIGFLSETNVFENLNLCRLKNTHEKCHKILKNKKCRKILKNKKCHKILNSKPYMRQLMDSCLCNSSLNSDFDTTFAKPFNNLPSKQNRRKQNSKNSSRNNSKLSAFSSTLDQNPSVPDVLNLLKESGWIITPCDPVINYNVPEHPVSPTVVPMALQNQYGDGGSDMVLWSLTNREVSVSHEKKVNMTQNQEVSVSHEKNVKKKLSLPNIVQRQSTDRRNYYNSGFDLFRRHKFLNNDLDNLCSFEPLPKRKKKEFKVKPLHISDELSSPYPSAFKTFKTKDGLVYIQPPCIKKEPEMNFDSSDESSDSISEVCIELPDDHLAYEEAIKNGYSVSAPPTQLRNFNIPPLPEKKMFKPKRITKENIKPYVNKHKSKSTKLEGPNINKYEPKVTRLEDPIKEKAQNELKTIVSERPPDEVPDVVCMNIEGTLYVYHRKDS